MPPKDLGCNLGPSAISRKFPAKTESWQEQQRAQLSAYMNRLLIGSTAPTRQLLILYRKEVPPGSAKNDFIGSTDPQQEPPNQSRPSQSASWPSGHWQLPIPDVNPSQPGPEKAPTGFLSHPV